MIHTIPVDNGAQRMCAMDDACTLLIIICHVNDIKQEESHSDF